MLYIFSNVWLRHRAIINQYIAPEVFSCALDQIGMVDFITNSIFNFANFTNNNRVNRWKYTRTRTQNYIAHVIIRCHEIRDFNLFSFIYLLYIVGYSYPVDWWSLGIVAYEMRAGCRPFVIHSTTPIEEVKDILYTALSFPKYWSTNFKELIQKVYVCVFVLLYTQILYCAMYIHGIAVHLRPFNAIQCVVFRKIPHPLKVSNLIHVIFSTESTNLCPRVHWPLKRTFFSVNGFH